MSYLSNWLELSQLMPNGQLIAGVDEVGRGALFGPVVAAAVILPKQSFSTLIAAGIQDSKKLSANRRSDLAKQITEIAIAYSTGVISNSVIDKINILKASLLAMLRAVEKLDPQANMVLVDGNHLITNLQIPQQSIIKGDRCSLSIAAASIVAKVYRDEMIVRLATKYPIYDLEKNKGYGSPKHLTALKKYGASRLHRKSFAPCQTSQQLDLLS